MCKTVKWHLLLMLVLLPLLHCKNRPATFANKGWYSNQSQVLRSQLSKSLIPKQKVVALVSPHAGFIYSLHVAKVAYSQADPRFFKRVIVLGPSHYKAGKKAMLSDFQQFETPLGHIEQDLQMVKDLLRYDKYFTLDNSAQTQEHSVELQLPLIKTYFSSAKIVSILVPDNSIEILGKFASYIKNEMNTSDLLLVSTDMSHYPSLQLANAIDKKSFEVLESADGKSLLKYEHTIRKNKLASCAFCGIAPLVVSKLIYPPSEYSFTKVSYDTSFSKSGDKSRVVGYGGFIVKQNSSFTKQTKLDLLQLSKMTLDKVYNVEGATNTPKLDKSTQQKGLGAFVTLKNKGSLRGCIGVFESNMSLVQLISYLTIQASKDSRFVSDPISKAELSDLEIEISILSPLISISDYRDISISRDGIVIEKDGQRAVFLPQVATENNWDKKEFWQNLSKNKLGQAKSAYLSKQAKLYKFTTTTFSRNYKP